MEADSVLLDQAEPTDQASVLSRHDKPAPVEAFSVASSYPQTPRAISGLSRPDHAKEKVEKGPKVSFMTTLDRELFPTKMPQNRFGNEICPLRGAPHRGPGCYENEEKTNFWYDIEHKINSSKGYTLGARTGPRFQRQNVGMLVKMNTSLDLMRPSVNVPMLTRQNTFSEYQTPSPTAYQTTCTDAKTFDMSKKPFLVGADRFPVYRRDLNEVLPGAGAYEHEIKKNRQVQWHQSFGGTPIMMPEIQVRSIIDRNTEKLYSTKEEKKYNRKLAYMKLYYE